MIGRILFTLIVLTLVFSLFLSMLSVTVAFASEETDRAIDGMVEEEQKDVIIEMIESMDFSKIIYSYK